MATLKALIFDVDGTLADTERDGHRVAFNKAFKEAELDWHWDEALYGELLAVTGGKERICHYVEQTLRPSGQITANIASHTETSDALFAFAAKLHKRKTHYYLDMLQQGMIPLRAGAKRLIEEARESGLRLAIATTTTPENVSYLLTSTLGAESLDWFEVIAAGDIVPAKKPAPDIYHYALEKMGLSADEALAFEDSDNGIKSSNAAGLITLITINGYTQHQDFSKAAIVLSGLGEPEQGYQVLANTHQLSDQYTHVNIEMLQALYQQCS